MFCLILSAISSNFARSTSLSSLKRGNVCPENLWNHMYMQMEDVLSCSFAVLLDDADAIRTCGFIHRKRKFFRDLMNGRELFCWDIKDVDVVHFGNNECMTHVERSDVQKSHDCFVFIENAGWRLFRYDFAEYTCSIICQISSPKLICTF